MNLKKDKPTWLHWMYGVLGVVWIALGIWHTDFMRYVFIATGFMNLVTGVLYHPKIQEKRNKKNDSKGLR